MSDSKWSYIEEAFLAALIVLAILLTIGEPDLLDAIIKRVGGY